MSIRTNDSVIDMHASRYIGILAGVSFVLHMIWENAQAPLYAGYQGFWQHFSVCLAGTFGDVAITLGVLLVMQHIFKQGIPIIAARHYLLLTLVGFVIGVSIELVALGAGMWAYTAAMPTIFFGVGLTPVLQMTILLPLSFKISQMINGVSSNPVSPPA